MTTRVDELAARVRAAEQRRAEKEAPPRALDVGPPVLLTRKEAARRCSVSITPFDRYIRPHLQLVKVGGRLLVDVDDLQAWVRSQRSTCDDSQTAPLSVTAQADRRALTGREAEIFARLQARRAKLAGGPT